MNRRMTRSLMMLGVLAAGFRCGDDDAGPGPTTDGGSDAGDVFVQPSRGLCVQSDYVNPECDEQSDCGTVEAIDQCEFCPSDPTNNNYGVCTFGVCEDSRDLANEFVDNAIRVPVNTAGFRTLTDVLVGVAIQSETAGGGTLTCREVRRGEVDLDNPV
ncbi:MAG: hypothetical protein HC923_11880 [Myxococcales bacterium]|nr:hypothetical protein [Myxococcales bacterium]